MKEEKIEKEKKKGKVVEEEKEDVSKIKIGGETSSEEDEESSDEGNSEKGESKEKKEKEKKKAEAVVNIYTSFNNTIVHVTDMSGKTLAKVTGGMVTKHGRLKANPTIAMFIAKRIAENLHEIGIGSLYFRIRAKTRNPAPGRVLMQ